MISRPDFAKKQILFVFTTRGEKISFSNDNIVVRDSDGKIKHQSTCYRLFLLCVVGETTITSGLLQRAHRFEFSICLFNRNMKLYEIFGARMDGNTILHQRQYEYDGLELGKKIVHNKIINQAATLKKIRYRPDSTNAVITDLYRYAERTQRENLDLQEILGIEGLAARIYFRELFLDYDWKGRKPRIKIDYINSTLDIGYTILFNFVEAILKIFGFDIYHGVLHRQFYMRKSLVCDIVEPFRPIVDWQTRKALNLGQCVEDDFAVINHRYQLEWKNSPKYTLWITEAIMDNKMEIYQYIQAYYRSFMKQRAFDFFPVFEMV